MQCLRLVVSLFAQVASPAELEHALRLGFMAEQIVLDSPAKTRRDLRRALAAGVRLNADNFEELERIDAILAQIYGGGGKRGMGSCTSPSIGVRVNPQLGGARWVENRLG